MSDPRLRVVRVPLNAEQREKIRRETGEEVVEALIAAPVPHEGTLENELVGQEAEKLAQALWCGNATFAQKMDQNPAAKQSFEQYIEHKLDARYPMLAMLR